MRRERITITKWRMEEGSLVRALPDMPTPYDYDITDYVAALGRIDWTIHNKNQLKCATCDILIDNSSEHIPPLATGIDYGYYEELARNGYYYEVTIEIQGAASDDGQWMVVGRDDDMIANGFVPYGGELEDAPHGEKWVAVLGGFVMPFTMEIDEKRKTILMKVADYSWILNYIKANIDLLGAYEQPLYVARMLADVLYDLGFNRDYDLLDLPEFGTLTRAVSAGGGLLSPWLTPSGLHLLGIWRISEDEYYAMDSEGNGYRGNPETAWTAATLSEIPFSITDTDTGDGIGDLFRPEQSGFDTLSAISGWDVDTDGFPHKIKGTISPYRPQYGTHIDWRNKRLWMITWSRDTGRLYLQPVQWSGVETGWTPTSGELIFGSQGSEPEKGWVVIPSGTTSTTGLFINKPNSDTLLWVDFSGTIHAPGGDIADISLEIDWIGEIRQWTHAETTVELLVDRKESTQHDQAGYHSITIRYSGVSGMTFIFNKQSPHNSVKDLPKGKAIRTADSTNPTGYRWSCPVRNSDGSGVLWIYDDNWQLLDKIDFGPVYVPVPEDSNEAYRDYFGCTADGEWIAHEGRIYRYGSTTNPAVRINRPKQDAEDSEKPNWTRILSDALQQIFCCWWIRPDKTLRVKKLYKGQSVPRDASKLVENAIWNYWIENKDDARLDYGTAEQFVTMGISANETHEVSNKFVSTRSLAQWLVAQYWALHCTEQSECRFRLREFTTEIYNNIFYGTDWILHKLEITNGAQQIWSEAEALSLPMDVASVIANLPDPADLLIEWQGADGIEWRYSESAVTSIAGVCAAQLRALLDAWIVLLNEADPPFTTSTIPAMMPYLMEHFSEWTDLAAEYDTCMIGA